MTEAAQDARTLTAEEASARAAAAVGHHYIHPDTYLVGREKVREYARASQFSDPVHYDLGAARAAGHADLVAPPMLVSIAGIVANRPLFDGTVLGYGTSQLIQADETMVYHQPIVAGHELTCHVHVDKHRRVGGYDMMTIRNEMYSQDDEHLATFSTTLIGGSTGGEGLGDEASELAKQVVMHGTMAD